MPTVSTPAPSGHSPTIDRRRLLAAVPAIAATAAVPAALTTGADTAIEQAWSRRQAAYARYNALPFAEEGTAMTAAEAAEWAIVDEAEEFIRSATATTPRGVAIQIWTSLSHCFTSGEHDQACTRGDLDALMADDHDHDWNVRLALSALRSLKTMGA